MRAKRGLLTLPWLATYAAMKSANFLRCSARNCSIRSKTVAACEPGFHWAAGIVAAGAAEAVAAAEAVGVTDPAGAGPPSIFEQPAAKVHARKAHAMGAPHLPIMTKASASGRAYRRPRCCSAVGSTEDDEYHETSDLHRPHGPAGDGRAGRRPNDDARYGGAARSGECLGRRVQRGTDDLPVRRLYRRLHGDRRVCAIRLGARAARRSPLVRDARRFRFAGAPRAVSRIQATRGLRRTAVRTRT